jgi:hypothetical protein
MSHNPEISLKRQQLDQYLQYWIAPHIYMAVKTSCNLSSKQKFNRSETRCYLTFVAACAQTPSTGHMVEEQFIQVWTSI